MQGIVICCGVLFQETEQVCQHLGFECLQKYMGNQESMTTANTRDSSQTKDKMDFGAAKLV